jgi:hypothetical protein
MMVLWMACLALGVALLAAATTWARRTGHERRVWRTAGHETSKLAIMLEIEDCLKQLDPSSPELSRHDRG